MDINNIEIRSNLPLEYHDSTFGYMYLQILNNPNRAIYIDSSGENRYMYDNKE